MPVAHPVLQILYAVPSERRLCGHLQFNLLFRWLVGLDANKPVWHPITLTQNRERLLTGEVAEALFTEVRRQAGAKNLLSCGGFSVDGTLVEAAASLKSFVRRGQEEDRPQGDDPRGGSSSAGRRRDRKLSRNFRGKRRTNETHVSTTDAEALPAKRARGASRLCYLAHVMTENRCGLIVRADLSRATGTAEREVALEFMRRERDETKRGRITLAADRGYDARGFVRELRALGVIPHVARMKKHSAVDGRTTSWEGYAESQKKRKLTEETFGRMKTVELLHKLRHRGRAKARLVFRFTAACYNLVRVGNLMPQGGG